MKLDRTVFAALSAVLLLSSQAAVTLGFGIMQRHCSARLPKRRITTPIPLADMSLRNRAILQASLEDDDEEEGAFHIEPLEPEDWQAVGKDVNLDSLERAWRYAKKPLLSIGAKGATLSHGNSLRQLLEQHTVVKVKINTRRFDGSLQAAFEQLRSLAEENGAPPGIELIQSRDADKIILFGWPGTMDRIKDGHFPISGNEKE